LSIAFEVEIEIAFEIALELRFHSNKLRPSPAPLADARGAPGG